MKTLIAASLAGGLLLYLSCRSAVTHAGCIAYRKNENDNDYHFLIVTARGNRQRWVLPKGKIDRGETPAEAALRELYEEAGCKATIVKSAGILSFFKWPLWYIKIHFYLVQPQSVVDNNEDRLVKWVTTEEIAHENMPFSMKRFLLNISKTLAH